MLYSTKHGISVAQKSYTTLTNFRIKYLVLCKVYTDVGGIKKLYHDCPSVRKIIHSLKLMDYLHVQADNQWYNYYLNWWKLKACLVLQLLDVVFILLINVKKPTMPTNVDILTFMSRVNFMLCRVAHGK